MINAGFFFTDKVDAVSELLLVQLVVERLER